MYHVIVCACNSVGCGQPSPVVNFTTVQALPGEHYIELDYSLPNVSSIEIVVYMLVQMTPYHNKCVGVLI